MTSSYNPLCCPNPLPDPDPILHMDVHPVNYILVVPMIYLCAIFQKNLLPHVVCLSNIRQNLKKICVPVAFNRGQLVKRLHPVLSLHVLLRCQLSLGGVSLFPLIFQEVPSEK